MAATLSRIVLGPDGDVQMIVHPDSDTQLSNVPEFSPAGLTFADVLRTNYNAVANGRGLYALIQPVIAAKRQILGDIITQRIALIDALQQLQTDRDLLNTRLDAGGANPTPAQTTLINLARAKVLSDLQDIQTIRDAIAALIGQLQ